MGIENACYALVQIAHNFGAAAVIGSPACVLYVQPHVEAELRLARLTLLGWIAQALSGMAFGAVSCYYYGEFPDVQAIALGALGVKIGCTVLGTALGLVCLRPRVAERVRWRAWWLEAVLSIIALSAAAIFCSKTLVSQGASNLCFPPPLFPRTRRGFFWHQVRHFAAFPSLGAVATMSNLGKTRAGSGPCLIRPA